MKRTKAFRPRRGIHFSDDRGPRPTGGFVGGTSTDRTRPTAVKRTLQLKKFASVYPTGSVGRSVRAPDGFTHFQPNPGSATPVVLTGSIFVAGSVSYGRKYARAKYNSTLLGLSASNAIDAAPYSPLVDANLTGSLTSPSWTHKSAGFNQAFVGVSLSSSYVETHTLNYFRSGSAALESSPVPASASLFYSKEARLKTIVVKHTASFFDTVIPTTGTVPTSFVAGTGTLCSLVTGNLVPSQVAAINVPATIFLSVPVTGRLVDLKVWVDVIHLSGGAGRGKPLGILGVSLRPPNLSWGHAHPIYQDKNFLIQTSFTTAYPTPYPNFYKDSFLLWEGGGQGPFAAPYLPGADNGAGTGDLVGGQGESKYPTFERDRSMRTIFHDGARIPNPRQLLGTSPSGNFNGAPNASSDSTVGAINVAYGMNVPWTSDGGGLAATDPVTYTKAGSPPPGWLSGPGGTNGANEWPTTGVNYGATHIRPVYPMLDPIYIRKTLGSERAYDGGVLTDIPAPTPDLYRGFRPGLRGTEISGTWALMFICNSWGGNQTDYPDLYFRQARLEITYESPLSSSPARIRRGSTRRSPLRNDREYLLWTISGTDSPHFNTSAGTNLDYFPNSIYAILDGQGSIGRTFGVVLDSGSLPTSEWSLLYRLSGTIGGISGSTPGWLLNNQFGVPQIPVSSASLAPVTPTVPTSLHPGTFISPSKLLDGARRLEDVAQDVNPKLTLIQIAAEFVSGSNT